MRVLHVGKFYPPYMGGMETHLQALCGELRKSLHVEVIVANTGRQDVEEYVEGVRVRRLGTWLDIAGAPVCRGMVRQIRDTPADIIHLHHPHPTAFLAYLASGHPGRLVVTWHGDIVRQRVLGQAFTPILHRTLRGAAAIIATSPNYVDSSQVLSAHRGRCRVIPLGIHTEHFEHCDPAALRSLREAHGPRIILGVGRLVEWKGFQYLIEAMTRVQAKLLLVGDGPARSELERKAKEDGVADRVVFVGNLGGALKVAPYYHAADVFAFPSISRNESFGTVQVEAMAAGTPVVNTHLDSGVPFVSLDGETGVTVPPADTQALATGINSLLDDAVRRQAYGCAGRERARREFSLEVMVERTLQLYGTVLEGAAQPERAPMRHHRRTDGAYMKGTIAAP